ncbi:MAG: hypothetical protein ABJM06_03395 [Gilvibacter sp.]|uniref:hypothetical protein n=1 Tax=Nonlabens ulvanivorans TaxID=906888 RepID=UPI00329746C0
MKINAAITFLIIGLLNLTGCTLEKSQTEPFIQKLAPAADLTASADHSFIVSELPFKTSLIPLNDDAFVGDYLVEQISPSIFGYDTFDPDGGGIVLTLLNNETAMGVSYEPVTLTSMQRAFDADYIAELGFNNTQTYIMEFFSEKVYLPYEERTFLACAGESIFLGFPDSVPGLFDIIDDSEFTLRFLDDVYNVCNDEQLDVELKFTKL